MSRMVPVRETKATTEVYAYIVKDHCSDLVCLKLKLTMRREQFTRGFNHKRDVLLIRSQHNLYIRMIEAINLIPMIQAINLMKLKSSELPCTILTVTRCLKSS